MLKFSKIIETIHIDSKRKNGFVSDKIVDNVTRLNFPLKTTKVLDKALKHFIKSTIELEGKEYSSP